MKNEKDYTPADEKALALSFAMTALIKTLAHQKHLDMDLLFKDLSGARRRLESLGEDGAAKLLGAFAESLQAVE
ncbi:MAG: hypothetical protein ABN479_03845 [Billgrantia sp.]|uniref:Uncharacterized protein n=1 Tax=Thioalkalivibrio sulfidiphilus (strain HL-EbGR7) TaxID=396588 RepID=B8GS45_THISH|nr:hypothetical protein [Thioalkalivibrio sulfidiphilus]ACL72749.1 hypothetical protein Tgr7_1666 [Thioalkalivibrio sulfidiphilus HL-EbGr7]